MPSPTITIRVEPELLAQMEREMHRTGETRTAWLRSAILSHISRESSLPNALSAKPQKPPKRSGRTTADAKVPSERKTMCVHRVKPGAFCKRCDS